VDEYFGFSRYAEHLGIRAHDFNIIKDAVEKTGLNYRYNVQTVSVAN
jgi:hypothetical protein